MSVLELTKELKQMSNTNRLLIIEVATKLIRNEIKDDKKSPTKKLSLRESAELLYEDYLHDEELTAVTRALDGEDFYDV